MSDSNLAFARPDLDPEEVRAFLRAEPGFVRDDFDLLKDLGLRMDAANMVDFGPAALARATQAHRRESDARQRIETTAHANFVAQAQTHAAVIDLLDSRNHSDLALRVDEMARHRFGLAAGVVALEGPDRVPAGWHALAPTQAQMIVGAGKAFRMGFHAPALGLFGERAGQVKSMALLLTETWMPGRVGVIGFGSADPEGFTADMGPELVGFLARVVERTAERWPAM
jgi:uncharacterized protein